jgi:type I restriction enzyme S subunit
MSQTVKPGYKQTEVGVIPEEWEVKQLSAVSSMKSGESITASRIDQHSQYPCYGGNGLRGFTSQYTHDGAFALIGRQGALCGNVVGVSGKLFASEHAVVVTPRQGTNIQFLTYVLGEMHLNRLSEASAQPGLSVSKILQLSIATPRKEPEQRAIAEALSDVDALLAALDRLIAKQRDLKQAAMQQLLTGQTRLPGFAGKWETKTLFELAERKKELFDDGDWIESEHITTEGIRLIQTGNIGVGRFTEKDAKKFIYEKSFISLRCKQLRQGDLLVCRLADPAGRACVLPDIGEERVVTSVDVTIFRPPPEVANRVFLANVFSTPEWFRAVSDRSGGTTHKRISRGALGRISITLPPLPEQTAIAAVLTDMDATLSALEQRRDKTRALKQGMMQELLTGRTRLV